MKEITKKQRKDLNTIKYFIPSWVKYPKITKESELMFLEYSERGLHKNKINDRSLDGFNALIQGKRWRGIHVHEMYEDSILEGSIPYYSLIENMPIEVVEFIAKEIFQGKDKKLILELYDEQNKIKKLILKIKLKN